ncbi:hypothetical protein [Streptomyces sp. TP-A0356]|uniref:hypothetical protein n=1 Tax=Streptomyces sp. TP-A0356 TaxID=1359208 RepID=UPI000AB60687|nr:hypothetical protein [Streptomyces sp. TP-A0356]
MAERHDGSGRTARPPAPFGRGSRTPAAVLAALRPRHLDAEAEARAVAAFRDSWKRWRGVRSLRLRRRDDWRPRVPHRTGRVLRTLLAVLLDGHGRT